MIHGFLDPKKKSNPCSYYSAPETGVFFGDKTISLAP